MPEDILADIPKEGKGPFEETDEQGKEPSADSPTEKKTEQEKSPSQEGGKESIPAEDNVPFHKHPRFTELTRENRELKQAVSELSKFREEAEPKLKELGEKGQPIPGWFADTFGDNPNAWEKYQSYEKDLRQQIKDEIYAEQAEYEKQQAEEGKKWSSWTETQIQQLKDDGLKFDQNELLKVLVEYKPVDDEGNLDFHKGYEIYSKFKAAEDADKSKKTSEKKRTASTSMEGESGEKAERKYKTSKDLRNKDWGDYDLAT